MRSIRERFWAKVNKSGNCWVWTGARSAKGYGRFNLNGKNTNAHRVSYLLAHKRIGANRIIRHSCDNPPCVRLSHLLEGTHLDNVMDMMERGRHKGNGGLLGEKHPMAKLTEADVLRLRELKRNTKTTYRELGKIYGVRPETIFYAVKGKNWSYL